MVFIDVNAADSLQYQYDLTIFIAVVYITFLITLRIVRLF